MACAMSGMLELALGSLTLAYGRKEKDNEQKTLRFGDEHRGRRTAVSWLFTKLKGLEQPEHTGYIRLYSHDSTPRTQPLS